MTKRSIYCSVPEKTIGSLHYLVIEYSAVDPVEFLRSILLQYKFGILLIGSDGPNPLIPEQSQLLVQGMQSEGIPALMTAGFPWVSSEGVPKLCSMKSFTCQGDALLLKTQPVEGTFECPYLPYLSGFNKDKLKAKEVKLLNTMLSFRDVYVCDDFAETLVVAKSSDILRALTDEVELLRQKYKNRKK